MKNDSIRPPKWADNLLVLLCKKEIREIIQGDLYEIYLINTNRYGKQKADRLYAKEVLQILRPRLVKKLEGTQKLNNYGMFKNYFKVGIRNILKYKVFSFINVFGLAVAMSVCMLLILMLADQKSYDQFHVKKDRVYRILGMPNGNKPYATVALPLAQTLSEDYPIIEESVSLRSGVGGDASFDQKTVELRGYFTDNAFFRVFDFPFAKGDKKTALSEPNTIVISTEKAYQLFNTENPIGKHVQFDDRGLNVMDFDGDSPPVDWGNYTIVGVIDQQSIKSHLKFDALMSASTLPILYKDSLISDVSNQWDNYWTSFAYTLLKKEASKDDLEKALQEIAKTKYAEIEDLNEYKYMSQELTQINPGILVNNDATFRLPEMAYYILSLLAFVIMVMACLNYTNLSIARSLSRMKEIGVRKVTGATRKNLIFQFLTESIVTVMISMLLAIFILFFTKEAFMGLWANKYLNFELGSSIEVYLVFFLFSLFIGVIAGIYPALFLSKHQPVKALSNDIAGKGKWGLQKVLNVSQFVVSLIFIITSIVIYNQFEHYTKFEYGFDTENIVNIPLQSNEYKMLSNEMKSVAGVTQVSACEYILATGTTNVIDLIDPNSEEKFESLMYLSVDEFFLDNLGLEIIAGKNVPPATSAGSDRYIVINESAVLKLGYARPEGAIGNIWESKSSGKVYEVIGVVENFRASLLVNGDETRPLILANNSSLFNYMNIKIAEGNPMKTISMLEEKWKSIDDTHEFKYAFFDNELANTNLAIFDIVSIIGYISFLAIMISCLGLLGMATYTTERKTKEIGIRKVLGAEELNIVMILSKGFLKLLLIAVIIAVPLSYMLNTLWLDNLSNRVDFGFGTVVLGSFLLLVLGLLTIGSQTIRASRKNPVDLLRYE